MNGNGNNIGSMELVGAIYSQVQTNFNGLVQLAEAETNFQREVYKRLKAIDQKFEDITDMLDKIYKACEKSNGKPETDLTEATTKKTTKK